MNTRHETRNLKIAITQAKGCIFDMDGTILDSHEAHYISWDKATREHGFPHERHEIIAEFGKTTAAITAALCNTEDPATIRLISDAKEARFLDEIPSIALFPGIMDMFQAMKQAGKRVCIASSNNNEAIERIIQQFHLDRVTDGFVGLNDIVKGKPDPEMIIKSATKLGLSPTDCLVIGDTIYDIMAGNAAGCFSIGVTTGSFTREQLASAGAGAVLPAAAGLRALVKNIITSPPNVLLDCP